jgi:hypothetical protein
MTEDAMRFLNETNRLDTISTAAAHGNLVIVDTRGGDRIVETVAAVKAATPRARPAPVAE